MVTSLRILAPSALFQFTVVQLILCSVSAFCHADSVNFEKQIQPIFKKNCYDCHGPHKQESGLRLDQRQEALAGGQSGPAIVPNDSGGSLLIQLVSSDDPEKVMPPKGDSLTRAQIELLKKWIDDGAQWPE